MAQRKIIAAVFVCVTMFLALLPPFNLFPQAWGQPQANMPAVAASDMQIIAQPNGTTRFVVVLSRAVDAKAFVIERPNRVVIEMPEVAFPLGAKNEPRKDGLVAALRYGLFAPGRSRIVLELTRPVAVTSKIIEAQADGRFRLAVDLTRVEQDTFHKTALAEAAVNVQPPARVPNGAAMSGDNRPLIMIDPGHGGIDVGAKSGDILEKDIVFSFAKALKDTLRLQGKYRVILTRDSDVFVPLDERMNMGRAAHADLFISIHADTISVSQVRGFTVYTGSEKATDSESARLAEKENDADAVGGIEVARAPDGVSDILQDLTLRETRNFSSRLASILVANLRTVMEVNKTPHRSAGFRVLRAPDMPSALVELGYMSSAKDIDLMQSDEWRTRSATAIAEALDQYFAVRTAN